MHSAVWLSQSFLLQQNLVKGQLISQYFFFRNLSLDLKLTLNWKFSLKCFFKKMCLGSPCYLIVVSGGSFLNNILFNPNFLLRTWHVLVQNSRQIWTILDRFGQVWTSLDKFGQEYWFRIQELHLLCKRTAIYKQTQLYNVWLNSPIAIEANKSPKDGLEVLFKKWYRFLQVWRFRRILLSFSLFWRVELEKIPSNGQRCGIDRKLLTERVKEAVLLWGWRLLECWGCTTWPNSLSNQCQNCQI